MDTLPAKMQNDESGIVNSDDSSGNGIHWVCYYNDPAQKYVEYFDPFGVVPDPALVGYMKSSGKPIYYNPNQLQQLKSNLCGYYCAYYIHSRAAGKSAYDILYEFDQLPSGENEAKMESIANEMSDGWNTPRDKVDAAVGLPTAGPVGTNSYPPKSSVHIRTDENPAAVNSQGPVGVNAPPPRGGMHPSLFRGLVTLATMAGVGASIAAAKAVGKYSGEGFLDFVKNFSVHNLLTNNKAIPELHLIDSGYDGKIRRDSFAGPFTKLDKRLELENGHIKKIITPPNNALDKAAMYHDVAYVNHTDLAARHAADRDLMRIADIIAANPETGTLQKTNARLVSKIMKSKIDHNW